MKIILAAVFFVCLTISAVASAQSPDPNFHIYLCFGQSNMEGVNKIEDRDRQVEPRFRMLAAVDFEKLGRRAGEWYDAVPPLCRSINGVSPADYFGRTMVANTPKDVRIGVVVVAIGGCKIELFDKQNYNAYLTTAPNFIRNWSKEYGNNPYQRLVDMGRRAQQDGVIKGILLHQGESNTNDRQWPAKVKGVYENLLADLKLNARDVPLLVGELADAESGGRCASMNAIIRELPKTVPTAHVVSSAGCACQPDGLHFTIDGYRELGRRYGETMSALQRTPATQPASLAPPTRP